MNKMPYYNKKGHLLTMYSGAMYSGAISMYYAYPCGCNKDFENRPEIFVDKHAPDGGDGLTLETAYNDLNKTIFCHPNTKISIKGYGAQDAYEMISVNCIYLNGLNNDVFIDKIYKCSESKFVNLNFICNDSHLGRVPPVYSCNDCIFIDCISSTWRYNVFVANKNCVFINCHGIIHSEKRYAFKVYFYNFGSIFQNCTAEIKIQNKTEVKAGIAFAFNDNSKFISCKVDNFSEGFTGNDNSNFTDCSANNNVSYGFYGNDNSTFKNCTANNNGYYDATNDNHCYACGFRNNNALYLNCKAIGNHHQEENLCDECNGGV